MNLGLDESSKKEVAFPGANTGDAAAAQMGPPGSKSGKQLNESKSSNFPSITNSMLSDYKSPPREHRGQNPPLSPTEAGDQDDAQVLEQIELDMIERDNARIGLLEQQAHVQDSL